MIDFDGYIDGIPFEGGKAEAYDLTIGSHSFIDTFEEQLIGKNIGEECEVNVTFPEAYHAKEVAGKPAMFKVTVKEIKEKERELDGQIAAELRRESDYLFTLQLRDYLIKKAGLKMPEAFLKRWLYTINEGKFSMEEIEKDFDQFLKMFTWNYMQKHFIQSEKIAVSKDEAVAEAKALAAAQFAQYGMRRLPTTCWPVMPRRFSPTRSRARRSTRSSTR